MMIKCVWVKRVGGRGCDVVRTDMRICMRRTMYITTMTVTMVMIMAVAARQLRVMAHRLRIGRRHGEDSGSGVCRRVDHGHCEWEGGYGNEGRRVL